MTSGSDRSAVQSDVPDEIRPVTALFADIVGSTGLGERLQVAEIKALVGECVTRMCEVVERFGGCVTAQMGDGIAAFFGLEATREDDAIRAARAALEIKEVIGRYAAEVDQEWEISDFDVRLGVNTGRVAIGLIGAGNAQLHALGDPVNVAARLQSAARPGRIVVGAGMADALEGRFDLVRLGELEVKGRSETVEAFELASADRTPRTARSIPFVARDPELVMFDTLIAELHTGRAQACFVIGEAGIGKSRLLDEARQRVPSDVIWLDGTCDPIDNRTPYDPFIQILRSWLGVGDRSSAIETRVKLLAKGAELLGDRFEDVCPYLARLLGVTLTARAERRLDGLPLDVVSRGLASSYVEWVGAVARRSPFVIAIDNFSFASDACAELSIALIDALDEIPVLMILAMRPEPRTPAWRSRIHALTEQGHRVTDMQLRSLSDSDAGRLVDELDGGEFLDDGLRGLVVARAEGNPLYIEELFAAVANAGPSHVGRLPRALEALLVARVDALPQPAKRVVQAAAVLGRTFHRDVLDRMGLAADLDEAIASLLRAEVIREQSRSPIAFGFRHGLVRDAALSTLTGSRTRELSLLAADAMRGWDGFDEERDSEALCRHLVAAGAGQRAIEYLENLADRMACVYRYEEAADLLTRCFAETRLGDPRSVLRVGTKLAHILNALGRADAALSVLDEIDGDGLDPAERGDVGLTRATLLADHGDVIKASALAEQILTWPVDDTLRTRTAILQARLALDRQDVEAAARTVESLGDTAELPTREAFEATSIAAGAAAMMGDFDEAESLAVRARSLAGQLGPLTDELAADRRVALTRFLKGSVREAYDLTIDVYERYARIGFRTGQVDTAINLLHMSHLVGALERGIEIAEDVLEFSLPAFLEGMVLANVAVLRLEQGGFDDAEELARRVLTMPEDTVVTWPRTTARSVLTRILLLKGDVATAREYMMAVTEEAMLPGREAERATTYATLADIEMQLGNVEEAIRYVEEARPRLGASDRAAAVQLERALGTAFGATDRAMALAFLESARRSATEMGMRLEEARTSVALGGVDTERSDEHFDEAHRIFEECGCALGLRELAETRDVVLANEPVVR